MTGADLANRLIDTVTFTSSDFTGADFTDSLLYWSNLSGILTNATFEGTFFESSRLAGELSYTSFQGAVLASASNPNELSGQMFGSDLRGVDGTGLRLWTVSGSPKLDSAILQGATISGGDLSSASMVKADLTGATVSTSLNGTDMRGAILTDANLSITGVNGAILTDASLSGVRSYGLQGDPVLPADWRVVEGRLVGPGANLREASFFGGSLAGAKLADADLTGAHLHSDMSGADFARATIVGASFSGVMTGATGLDTVRYNGTTSWIGATCPDGKAYFQHVGQACTGAPDTSPPVPSIVSPGAFVWPAGPNAWLKVTGTDDGVSASELLYRLRWRTSTSGAATLSWSSWRTGTTYPYDPMGLPFPVSPGKRTCVQVQATDRAGNVSAWRGDRCFDVPYETTSLEQIPYWSGRQDDGWSNFLVAYTKTKGAIAYTNAKRYVRQVGVVATTCPTCGSIAVYVGSTKIGSLSLARSTTTNRALLLLPRTSSRLYGQVKIVVTSSSGRLVRLDDLALTAV